MTAAQQNFTPADRVGYLATRCVLTVGEFDTVSDARDLMTVSRVSHLAVIDGGTVPTGLVSKQDIARFLLEDGTRRSLEDFQVGEVCSYSYHTIKLDSPIVEAARTFDTANITCAVVLDDGSISGILTETDLCHYFSSNSPEPFKVSDFMMKDFAQAKSTYPIIHVAHMIVNKQSSVPVIDEKLVGILTLSDFLSITDGELDNANKGSIADKNDMALLPTKELMTRRPITVLEHESLNQAAQILISKQIRALPVVDDDSNVVGLLTKHDIVKALGSTPDVPQYFT